MRIKKSEVRISEDLLYKCFLKADVLCEFVLNSQHCMICIPLLCLPSTFIPVTRATVVMYLC